jgi:hypothetical protein
MGEERYERLIGQFSDAEAAMVFELGPLRELDPPVENDGAGVRGAWYTTLERLREATVLSALGE